MHGSQLIQLWGELFRGLLRLLANRGTQNSLFLLCCGSVLPGLAPALHLSSQGFPHWGMQKTPSPPQMFHIWSVQRRPRDGLFCPNPGRYLHVFWLKINGMGRKLAPGEKGSNGCQYCTRLMPFNFIFMLSWIKGPPAPKCPFLVLRKIILRMKVIHLAMVTRRVVKCSKTQ